MARIEPHLITLPTCDPNQTLAEAREELRRQLAAGKKVDCKSCGGTVGIYPRGLSKRHAVALLALYHRGPLDPKELAAISRTRDYPTLNYFGLAGVIDKGEHIGKWRITEQGRRFVDGRGPDAHIFSHVLLLHGEQLAFDERKEVTFAEIMAKGADFDLAELMAPTNVTEARFAEPGTAVRAPVAAAQRRGMER